MRDKLKALFDLKLWKFLLVGVVNTLIGAGIMFTLYNFAGFGYWPSSAANYLVGGIISFLLNKYFTFQNKERSFSQIIKFAGTVAISYGIGYGIARPLTSWLLSGYPVALRDNIAMLAGMCLYTGINYLGQRFFAFKEKTAPKTL